MWFIIIYFLVCLFDLSSSMINGLYCGLNNCYDVLGVTRDASKFEISRAYRLLALKFHPDKHKKEDKKQAAENFTIVADAYEILKDSESREDYNYFLDHPEQFYAHYYRYYKRKVGAKVDVKIVIIFTITVISLIQYLLAFKRYNDAINYLLNSPKYRNQALEEAYEEGILLRNNNRNLKKKEYKNEMDAAIREIIERNIDIKGGYAKPSVGNILWIQIIFLPYFIIVYFAWYANWIWQINICKKPYTFDQKSYLIRKYLGLTNNQWEAIPEQEKQQFYKLELWNKNNFEIWKNKKHEEMKLKLSESGRYKSYRRFMKNRKPTPIRFDE